MIVAASEVTVGDTILTLMHGVQPVRMVEVDGDRVIITVAEIGPQSVAADAEITLVGHKPEPDAVPALRRDPFAGKEPPSDEAVDATVAAFLRANDPRTQ